MIASRRPSVVGSSPLTRGKLLMDGIESDRAGLIPAHAGKTKVSEDLLYGPHGSSPLTRGKPALKPTHILDWRLIPAHAGKTQFSVL